jgi:hypothetical protein
MTWSRYISVLTWTTFAVAACSGCVVHRSERGTLQVDWSINGRQACAPRAVKIRLRLVYVEMHKDCSLGTAPRSRQTSICWKGTTPEVRGLSTSMDTLLRPASTSMKFVGLPARSSLYPSSFLPIPSTSSQMRMRDCATCSPRSRARYASARGCHSFRLFAPASTRAI